jgi:4-amino-4-deoxy-L-arabinose transferase-like glycosyltransferase
MSPALRFALVLTAAAAVFVTPALGRDLWTPDEPRYAEVSREMMLSGDYLVPRVNNEIYREKPPLLFWLISAASWPAGTVTEFTARIPSLLSAMMVLFLVYGLARRMFDERTGLWSTIILATTFRFWWQANFGQIDMLLTACTTLCLYALWRWHESRLGRWGVAFHCGIALGLLAKGPPALVVTGLGALAFRWRSKESGKGLRLWLGIPLALVPVVAWFVFARREGGGGVGGEMGGAVSRQIVGRLFSGVSHPQPPWYYLQDLAIEWAPWSLFLPWAAIYGWRNRKEGPPMRLLLSWTVPALVFFHLSIEKRSVYLLPLFPAMAMVVARSVLALVDEDRRGWLRATAILWMPCLLLLSAAPVIARYTAFGEARDARLFLVPVVTLAALAWTAILAFRGASRDWPAALAVQAFAVLLVAGIAVVPVVDPFKSAKAFCAPVRALAAAGPVDVFSLRMIREEYVFYSKAFHRGILMNPGAGAFEEETDREAARKKLDDLRLRMSAACKITELGSLSDPSTADRRILEQAVTQALAGARLPAETVASYRAHIAREVADGVAALSGPRPAVLFARTEDWKWFLAFAQGTRFLTVLREERVAGRDFLLLANPGAVEVLKHVGAARGAPAANKTAVVRTPAGLGLADAGSGSRAVFASRRD